jgi:penicillin-binding protein 1A
MDAWFAGYSPKQVAVAWIGFDKPQTLGRNETGAAAALPIWIKYMASALKGVPETAMAMPDGVMVVNIDPTTGIRDEGGMAEYFYQENPPPQVESSSAPLLDDAGNPIEPAINQAQHLLQPEITLSPATPNKTPTNPAGLGQPAKNPKSDAQNSGQNAAAKLLNSN